MSEFPNSGIMNPNKYKRPGTKMPDFNGKATVTCKHCQQETEFELAAWNRGARFTTIAFTEKSVAEKRKADYAAKKAGLPTAAEQTTNEAADEAAQQSDESKPGEVPF